MNDRRELALVEWVDSASPREPWLDVDDAAELDVTRCTTVGFVLHSSDDRLVLAGSLGEENVGEVIVVPRCAIVSSSTLGYYADGALEDRQTR